MAFVRNIAAIGSYTLISRVLGFIRDILIAAVLGAGPIADAFFVAFKLPNFFRRLFAEGAFSAAFVPVFAGMLARRGRDEAMVFASHIASVLLWALLVFVILFEIAMPWFMYVLAPGFSSDPEKFDMAVEFSRLTFPYLLFIALVSLQGGILNSLERFAAMAATPIILNLTLIAAVLGFPGLFSNAGYALAGGVAVAGVLQFLWMWGALKRSGIFLRFPRPRLGEDVKKMLRLFMPAALGAGMMQVNLIIDVMIASLLPTGAISFLYYADRVNQLPLGVIGVAVGTAILPLISRQIKNGEESSAQHSLNRAIELSLLLTLPAAVALIIAGGPIIGVLFERGAFGPDETLATASAMAAFAFGLPAYVLIKVLAPAFFAREDTSTPVKIALGAMGVNIALNFSLMFFYAHVGIALATALAAWFNALLLGRMLLKRGWVVLDERLKTRVPRMVFSAMAMGGVLSLLLNPLAAGLDAGALGRGATLMALVLAGMVSYGAFVQLSGAGRLADLAALRRGRNPNPASSKEPPRAP